MERGSPEVVTSRPHNLQVERVSTELEGREGIAGACDEGNPDDRRLPTKRDDAIHILTLRVGLDNHSIQSRPSVEPHK